MTKIVKKKRFVKKEGATVHRSFAKFTEKYSDLTGNFSKTGSNLKFFLESFAKLFRSAVSEKHL